MSARFVAVLVVLLVVLGGGALLYHYQEGSRRPENVATLGQPLFKDLRAADIAAIRIVEPKSTLTVQRKEDGWVIAERDGFPADVGKVREFVVKILGLKVGQSEPIGDKDRARLNLDVSGTQVELNGVDGKSLGKLTVGKKYFKREVENPDKAPADGRFVALPAEATTVYTVSDPLVQAGAKSANWIDRTSFQVEKVASAAELLRPGGSGAPGVRTLLLVRDVRDAVALRELGVPIPRLNVGNIHFANGRRQVAPSVYLDPAEMEALARLAAGGTEVEVRAVPSEHPTPLSVLQSRFSTSAAPR